MAGAHALPLRAAVVVGAAGDVPHRGHDAHICQVHLALVAHQHIGRLCSANAVVPTSPSRQRVLDSDHQGRRQEVAAASDAPLAKVSEERQADGQGVMTGDHDVDELVRQAP